MFIRINGKLAKLKSTFLPANDLSVIYATFLFSDLTTETFLVKDTSSLFAALKFNFEYEIPSSIHAFTNTIEY